MEKPQRLIRNCPPKGRTRKHNRSPNQQSSPRLKTRGLLGEPEFIKGISDHLVNGVVLFPIRQRGQPGMGFLPGSLCFSIFLIHETITPLKISEPQQIVAENFGKHKMRDVSFMVLSFIEKMCSLWHNSFLQIVGKRADGFADVLKQSLLPGREDTEGCG